MQTNMHEAKSNLSQLVEAAVLGEKVIIAKSGKPVVQLVPCKPAAQRVFGALKGKIHMSLDFDSEETHENIINMFGV